MTRLKKIEAALTRLETGALAAGLTVMVSLAFLQVVLRIAFSKGLIWADTLLRHMVLVTGFLGAALATSDHKHFSWDTVALLCPVPLRRVLEWISALASILVTGWLIHASWAFMGEEKAAGSMLMHLGSTAVPAWAFALLFPIGFGLVLVHILLRLAQRPSEPETPSL